MIKDVPIIYTIVIHRSFKTWFFFFFIFFFGYSSSISRFQVPVNLFFRLLCWLFLLRKKKWKFCILLVWYNNILLHCNTMRLFTTSVCIMMQFLYIPCREHFLTERFYSNDEEHCKGKFLKVLLLIIKYYCSLHVF